MPLLSIDTAISDAVVDATAVDDSVWSSIWRQRTGDRLRCRGCGAPVHAKMRTASGLRFFAHTARSLDCPHVGETARHLELKGRFAEAFRAVGWVAELEAVGDGFRADVLASDGRRDVAVEVQLASMTADEANDRTSRHAAAGVETVWAVPERRASWAQSVATVAVNDDNEVVDSVLVPDGSARVRFAGTATIDHFVARLASGAVKMFTARAGPLTGADVGACYQLGDCATAAHEAFVERQRMEKELAAARRRALISRVHRIDAALTPKIESMTASLQAFQAWLGEHRPAMNCWFTSQLVTDPRKAALLRPHGDALILMGVSRPMWVFALAEPKKMMGNRDMRVAAWTVTDDHLLRFNKVYRPDSPCDIEQGELKRYEPGRRRRGSLRRGQ